MATPTTHTFRLPLSSGATGATVSVAVTSAGGDRPVVVLAGSLAALAGRLARAGFATVTLDPPSPDHVTLVLQALQGGALGLRAQRCGLVEREDDGWIVVTRIEAGTRLPGMSVRDDSPDRAAAAVVQWLTQHVV